MKEEKFDYLVNVTAEEYVAMRDLVEKMRAEKARQQVINKQRTLINTAVENAISVIGLEETKRIVRETVRSLRDVENIQSFV